MKKTKEILKKVTGEKIKESIKEDFDILDKVTEIYSESNDVNNPSIASLILNELFNQTEEDIFSGYTTWDGYQTYSSYITIKVKDEPELVILIKVDDHDSFDSLVDYLMDAIQEFTEDDKIFDNVHLYKDGVFSASKVLGREVSVDEVEKINKFIQSRDFEKKIFEMALKY